MKVLLDRQRPQAGDRRRSRGRSLLLIAWRGMLHKPAIRRAQNAPPAIAVDTAAVAHADVPIYLQGLGTVQAFYTVTVTARVDGELQKVGVHRRPDRAQGRPAGADRSAAEPGGLRPGGRHQGEGCGAARQCASAISSATRCCSRRISRASRPSTPSARLVDQLAAQLKVDQAVIDNARTQLDYTRITSPINGRTGIRLVDPGNIVHAADTTGIVVVTQVQPISVIFTLPEEELGAVAAALAAGPVKVTTLSRDGGANSTRAR
jgi:membrane fusion protein, multidrug efflux system